MRTTNRRFDSMRRVRAASSPAWILLERSSSSSKVRSRAFLIWSKYALRLSSGEVDGALFRLTFGSMPIVCKMHARKQIDHLHHIYFQDKKIRSCRKGAPFRSGICMFLNTSGTYHFDDIWR